MYLTVCIIKKVTNFVYILVSLINIYILLLYGEYGGEHSDK